MDYFQSVNPVATAGSPLAPVTATNGWFQFNVRYQPGLPDVTPSYQTSPDLLTWSAAVGVVTNGIASNPDGTQTLQLSLQQPTTTPALFLRLVLTAL
jgi:hypothetical protein